MGTTKTKTDESPKEKLDRHRRNNNLAAFKQVFREENYYESAPHVCYMLVEDALAEKKPDFVEFIFNETDIKPTGPTKNYHSQNRFAKFLIKNADRDALQAAVQNHPDMFKNTRSVMRRACDLIQEASGPHQAQYEGVLDYLLECAFRDSEYMDDSDPPIDFNGREEEEIGRIMSELPHKTFGIKLITKYGLDSDFVVYEKNPKSFGDIKISIIDYLEDCDIDEVKPVADQLANKLDNDQLKGSRISGTAAKNLLLCTKHRPQLLLTFGHKYLHHNTNDAVHSAVSEALGQLSDNKQQDAIEKISSKRAFQTVLTPHNEPVADYGAYKELIEQYDLERPSLFKAMDDPHNTAVGNLVTGLDEVDFNSELAEDLRKDASDVLPARLEHTISGLVLLVKKDLFDPSKLSFGQNISLNKKEARAFLHTPSLNQYIDTIIENGSKETIGTLLEAVAEGYEIDDNEYNVIQKIAEKRPTDVSPKKLANSYTNILRRSKLDLIEAFKPLYKANNDQVFTELVIRVDQPVYLQKAVEDFDIKGQDIPPHQQETIFEVAQETMTQSQDIIGVFNLLYNYCDFSLKNAQSVYKELYKQDDNSKVYNWLNQNMPDSTKAAITI